ncbi:MAG: hypothetical protein QOK05_2334 [Chloroflexota bacterium]|jgi:ketosteroid isomerase-like protein|nr:hypothetical protein [Chloroflexota bacterium]
MREGLGLGMSPNDAAAANAALLDRFYTAFQTLDASNMNACYAPEVRFRDPVFERLEGDRARAMWSMLAARSSGLQLTYELGKVDTAEGDATWVATYNFATTGRRVENHVQSHFWFKDGLISRQEDTFDLYKWASMALGPKGVLLGWLPPVQASIRKQAKDGLDKFVGGSAS